MTYILLLCSLALIIVGAQFLVDGASSIAKRYHVSEFVIGLTIVGIGTSMPELVVSFISAIYGKGDVAIGNVVGSNLANILLILGATALIRPMSMSCENVRRDVPFGIGVTVILLLMCFGFDFTQSASGIITRIEGIVLLVIFALFMYISFRFGKDDTQQEEGSTPKKLWVCIVMILIGFGGLIWGGNMFVDSATTLARHWGVPESVIAITLMAFGTSVPELATSIVAAIKHKGDMALGNIIGSNICNICLILGLSATVTPLRTGGIIPFDLFAALAASMMLLLSAFIFRRRTIGRADGAVYLLLYALYVYLLLNR